jgi:predicted ArsR family transcriptional regulator
MEQLITRREQQMQARYESRLTQPALADRLMTLKALRTQEGYMADMSPGGGRQLAVEEHCPICSAARPVGAFAAASWRCFAAAGAGRGGAGAVSAEGISRCLYRIRPQP